MCDFFSFTSHTKCQILNCACWVTCISFFISFVQTSLCVECQRLAKKFINNKIFKIYMQTNSLVPQPIREIRKQQFLRYGSHGVPSFKSQSHLRSMINPCNLNRWDHGSWDLPLHNGPKSQVLSVTWMHAWQHVLDVRQMLYPTLNMSHVKFMHKVVKIQR